MHVLPLCHGPFFWISCFKQHGDCPEVITGCEHHACRVKSTRAQRLATVIQMGHCPSQCCPKRACKESCFMDQSHFQLRPPTSHQVVRRQLCCQMLMETARRSLCMVRKSHTYTATQPLTGCTTIYHSFHDNKQQFGDTAGACGHASRRKPVSERCI